MNPIHQTPLRDVRLPFISSTRINDSEAMSVSDERNTGERQFALQSTEQHRTHRSNFRMTTLLFNTSVRANHQHPRSRNHKENAALIFCLCVMNSDSNTQQHVKSNAQAFVLSSWLAAILVGVKTLLQGVLSVLCVSCPQSNAATHTEQ